MNVAAELLHALGTPFEISLQHLLHVCPEAPGLVVLALAGQFFHLLRYFLNLPVQLPFFCRASAEDVSPLVPCALDRPSRFKRLDSSRFLCLAGTVAGPCRDHHEQRGQNQRTSEYSVEEKSNHRQNLRKKGP